MRILVIAALAGAVAIALVWQHEVPTELTSADGNAIGTIIAGRNIAPNQGCYDDQIRTIAAVQQAVLDASPVYHSIPIGHTREPADLLAAGQGLCFDRARTIEKTLAALGFEVRHVAIYPTIADLLLPTNAPSHALSEVRTARGWMLVDSVSRWLGLDAAGEPVSAAQLAAGGVELQMPIPDINAFMQAPFVPMIGLYSRHGKHYPPFTPFPDVNWRQLAENVLPSR